MATHRYETLIKAVIEINDDGSGDVTADLTFKTLEGKRFTADLMAGDEGGEPYWMGYEMGATHYFPSLQAAIDEASLLGELKKI